MQATFKIPDDKKLKKGDTLVWNGTEFVPTSLSDHLASTKREIDELGKEMRSTVVSIKKSNQNTQERIRKIISALVREGSTDDF